MEREITPEPGEGSADSIMVFVVGKGMEQIQFRIQLTQPMIKLKKHYSHMTGIPRERLDFKCGNRPVNDSDTALELSLKDNGFIDVQDLRTDASCEPKMGKVPEPDIQIVKEIRREVVNCIDVEDSDSDIEVEYENVWIYVTIKAEGLEDEIQDFQVNQPFLSDLKKTYSDLKKLNISSLSFAYKGHIVNDDDTPRTLKMMNYDVLWAYAGQ